MPANIDTSSSLTRDSVVNEHPTTGFRLSPLQQRLWRVAKSNRGAQLRTQVLMRLPVPVERKSLQAVIDSIAHDYEILRTEFVESSDGMVVQCILDDSTTRVETVDLPEMEGDAIWREMGATFGRLSAGSSPGTWRAVLISGANGAPHLYLSLPSLISDRRSLWLISGEIIRRCVHQPPETAADVLQYADIAEWKHGLLETQQNEDARLFWYVQTEGSNLCHSLSFAHKVPRACDFLPSCLDGESLPLPPGLGRGASASLETISLACWIYLCSQYDSANPVALGIVSDGRMEAETSSVVGPMTATLPLWFNHNPSESFAEFCARVSDHVLAGRAWQDLFEWEKFEENNLRQERPLFREICFEFVDESPGDSFDGCEILRSRADVDCFGLKLVATASGTMLTPSIEYDSASIDESEVARLLGLYVRIISKALHTPDLTLSELDAFCQSLAPVLLGDRSSSSPSVLLHQLFEQQAAATPDAIAVSDGGGCVSYGELNRSANRSARFLLRLGLEAEERVGILAPRSINTCVAVLAVLKAGGAFVPLEGAPGKRLESIVENFELKMILAEAPMPSLDKLGAHMVNFRESREEIGNLYGGNLPQHACGDNLAYVLFTSGSTGTPKGVMVPHVAIVNYLSWARYNYDREGTSGSVCFSPLDFDFTMTAFFLPLACGRTVLLAPADPMPLITECLSIWPGISFLKLTPAHLRAMKFFAPLNPRAARLLVIGGEALTGEDLSGLIAAGDTAVVNEYGPTEAAVGCSAYRVRLSSPVDDGAIPIGRPIWNTSLELRTGTGSCAFPGAAAEIWIGGKGIARGYIGRPDLTASVFWPDPSASDAGARCYRTGDLARLLPDDNLVFLGRIDDQVKLHGFRIELNEIAHAVRQHAAVIDAVAILTDENTREARIALFVQATNTAAFDEAEIRAFLAQHLPSYMVPTDIVPVDSIPLSPHGKVDRKSLRSRAKSWTAAGTTYEPPVTREERILVEIWKQVLKRETIGVDDNFFSLGGDSIRSIQVFALAQAQGLQFSLATILEEPTIRRLAGKIGSSMAPLPPRSDRHPFMLVSPEDKQRLATDVVDAYPMTRLQEGMIFHSEWDMLDATYHDIVSIHVQSVYDREVLARCLQSAVERHPVLRTVFKLREFSQPLQLVLKHADVGLEEHDLGAVPPDLQQSLIDEWMAQEQTRRFDWSSTPPYRFCIHRRGQLSFQFSFSFHHALLDGWSTATLLVELVQHYSHACGLSQGEFPRPPQSLFRDYVLLELQERNSKQAQEFWKGFLEDAPITLYGQPQADRLTAAKPRVLRHQRLIAPEIHLGLLECSRQLGVALKTVLLAVHLKVVATLTNLSEVVTGVVSNGRVDEIDGERVLGLFLNTQPVRFAFTARGWRQNIRDLYAVEARCARYRRLPIADILQTIGNTEIFDTAFNFVHYHLYENLQALSGIEVLSESVFEQTNFALLASFSEGGTSQQLTLLLDVDATRVRSDRLPAIADLYENAVRSVVLHPEASVLDVALLSQAEENQLRSWAIGEKADRGVIRVDRKVLEVARTMPDSTALVLEETHLSYRALAAGACQIAGWLCRHGVGPDQVVVLDVDRSVELMLLCLGTLIAGAAYLYLDRALPAERRRFILRDCNPSLVITDKNPTEFADSSATVCRIEGLIAESYCCPAAPPRTLGELDAACYLAYTSGSTGAPKGIVMTHRPVAELILWQVELGLDAAPPRTLQYTTLCFDVAFQEIFSTWCAGGVLVLMPEGMGDEPDRMWNHLRREQVERLFLPCAALKQLMTIHSQAGIDERLMLKEVITAGDVLHLTAELKTFFADHPSVRLSNHYGPAETHVVTAHTLEGDNEQWPALPPIGKPVAGVGLYLLNDRSCFIPIGATGEICLGGEAVSRGYLNRPDLTAERFVPDAQTGRPGERLYRTGDLARFLSDGSLQFLGRRDHQVKVRGYRVELGEIETIIASLAGVAEVVVESQLAADGENQLIAHVSGREKAKITAQSVLSELRRKLPAYMVPAQVMILERLPKTATGKVDRKALPPAQSIETHPAALDLPANPVEAEVLELWKRALQKENIGVADDFFAVGGHSLIATKIVVDLRARFGIGLPIKAVFELRSVRAVAARIRELLKNDLLEPASHNSSAADGARWVDTAENTASRPHVFRVRRISRDGELTLAPQQENWWHQELRTGSMLPNNVYYCIGFQGPFNPAALEQSLGVLHIRHEALRTAFIPIEEGGCRVAVAPPEPRRLFLDTIDLSHLPPGRQEEALLRIAGMGKSRPMDLAAGALWRACVVRLGADDHVIIMCIHHLVCDGWSIDILATELGKTYSWFLSGEPATLAEVPFQYVDFARWQYDWLTSPVFASQLAYWMRLLRPPWPDLFPPTSKIPAEFDTPFLTLRCRAPFVIGKELTEIARRFARENGCTLFSTVMAAVNLVLFADFGQPDIRVGTLAVNRDVPGSESVVGLFTNVICLRTTVSADQTFSELAHQVAEGVCDAAAHQELPFDVLMHALYTATGAYPVNLFQVMFLWQPMAGSKLELSGTRPTVVIPPPADTMAMGRGSLELMFNLEETPDELIGAISWKVGRFQEWQIERLARSLERCLARAGENPQFIAGQFRLS